MGFSPGEPAGRALGERVLRHLLLGTELIGTDVDAVRFAPVLDRDAADSRGHSHPTEGAYLGFDSGWTVFPGWPTNPPEYEEQLPELDKDDQLRILTGLWGRTVTGVTLGPTVAHL